MARILGTISSSFNESTSFFSIATFYSLGDQTSFTFSNIPGTYTHLQLRCALPGGNTVSSTNFDIQINGDTGTNYANHWVGNNSTTIEVGAQANNPRIEEMVTFRSGNTSPAGVIMDFLDYANTNKFKTMRTISGRMDATGGTTRITSHLWRSTSAITSVKVYPDNGNTFPPGCRIALYGIKG